MKRILFSRFALLSLGCIGALAVVMGFVLSSLLTRAASEWEWENTAALVRREVKMAGLERVFAAPGSPEERARWGREFSRLLTSLPEVVPANVWDNQATILWSDESHLIGRQFRDNEELREALTKQEHRYEQAGFTTLAEIYVPIFSGDGRVLGVVEVYKTPARLLATIRRGQIAIWTISLAGALLLYLVMHPLLTLVYRKEVEEETLRADTGRLTTSPRTGSGLSRRPRIAPPRSSDSSSRSAASRSSSGASSTSTASWLIWKRCYAADRRAHLADHGARPGRLPDQRRSGRGGGGPAARAACRPLRRVDGERYRRGHGRGHQDPHLRALLHDQGAGQGDGLGAVNGIRHRPAARRLRLGREREPCRHDVQDPPAARGGGRDRA